MLIGSLLNTYIKRERRAEVEKHLRSAANFFKHADRDHEGTYTFDPRQTEFLLFDACHAYKELTGELVPLLTVYWTWFFLGPGAALVDTTRAGVIEPLRRAFPGATRTSFFREALPIAATIQHL